MVCFGGTDDVGTGWPPLAIEKVFVRQGKAVQAESSNPSGTATVTGASTRHLTLGDTN